MKGAPEKLTDLGSLRTYAAVRNRAANSRSKALGHPQNVGCPNVMESYQSEISGSFREGSRTTQPSETCRDPGALAPFVAAILRSAVACETEKEWHDRHK